MIHSIENSFLKASIDTRGAELTSLKTKKDDLEYIWCGDPEYWKRHAPILFPIVGKVNNSKYRVEGKEYELPQHGFARDSEFALEDKGERHIEYSLSSDENTLKKYPYKFKLYIKYELLDEKLNISYKVENKDNKTIYFSIGAHPAFNCPLFANEEFNDYYLEFNEEETTGKYPFEDGNILDEKVPFLTNQKILLLSKELLQEGALIFENIKSTAISLKSNKNDKSVTVNFEGFPYLGIWSKESGAPFICIEPWYGIADFKDFNGELKDKKGILKLPHNDIFTCSHSFTIK